jgi:hypothetical protein
MSFLILIDCSFPGELTPGYLWATLVGVCGPADRRSRSPMSGPPGSTRWSTRFLDSPPLSRRMSWKLGSMMHYAREKSKKYQQGCGIFFEPLDVVVREEPFNSKNRANFRIVQYTH